MTHPQPPQPSPWDAVAEDFIDDAGGCRRVYAAERQQHRDAFAELQQRRDDVMTLCGLLSLQAEEELEPSIMRMRDALAAQAQELADLKAENTRLRTALESISAKGCARLRKGRVPLHTQRCGSCSPCRANAAITPERQGMTAQCRAT